jgi:hypothetical protein
VYELPADAAHHCWHTKPRVLLLLALASAALCHACSCACACHAGAPPFNADDPQQIFENILDQQVSEPEE